ncbi:hypothetical protein ACLOJK_008540 [Asimina triloba]
MENTAKAAAGNRGQQPKKRPALSNLTNQCAVGRNAPRAASAAQVRVSWGFLLFFFRGILMWVSVFVSNCLGVVLIREGHLAEHLLFGKRSALFVEPAAEIGFVVCRWLMEMRLKLPVVRKSSASPFVPTTSSASKPKKPSFPQANATSLRQNYSTASSAAKPSVSISYKTTTVTRTDAPTTNIVSLLVPCSATISSNMSDGGSVSMDETMSTCDSLKSPDIEYIDNAEASAVASLERRTCKNLYISDNAEAEAGDVCKREILSGMEIDKIIDVDDNHKDPQLCATIACDIYKHLRMAENSEMSIRNSTAMPRPTTVEKGPPLEKTGGAIGAEIGEDTAA